MEKNKERVPISVQRIIKSKMKKENITLTSLARELHMTPVSLYQLLERQTMQIDRLWSICVALEINLFQEIANHLDIEHYSPAVEKKEEEVRLLTNQVSDLEKEMELLKRERDSFKEAIRLLKG